jgi:hypothetical protein
MTPILLFDPRREHSFVPITKSCHRRDAGTVKAGRIFAATRGGLALIGPSTAACLPAWARGAARWPISNRWFSSIFTPLLTIPREGHPECRACAITWPAEGAYRICFGEKGCVWRALAQEAKEKPPRRRRKEKSRRGQRVLGSISDPALFFLGADAATRQETALSAFHDKLGLGGPLPPPMETPGPLFLSRHRVKPRLTRLP